jgi:hypothetical protein
MAEAFAPDLEGVTVTELVLGAEAGDAPVLLDAGEAAGHTHTDFAGLVRAAAAGLVRRGVRVGDVGAVHVAGARDFALAVHAITAAGAVPALLPPIATDEELGTLLTCGDVRFAVTAAASASLVLAAAERSYVREVFAFGDVPGTTPFAGLLAPGTYQVELDPLRDLALMTYDPPEVFTHGDRLADLYRLAGSAALAVSEPVVASRAGCPSATWIGLIDVALTTGTTFVAVTEPGLEPLLEAVSAYGANVVVLPPGTLRALAFDHAADGGLEGLRLLLTNRAASEVVQTCRLRHGCTVQLLR